MPFNRSQKERFLMVWCAAYERFMVGEGEEAKKEAKKKGEKNAHELIWAIENHPKICDLTTNPFLLTIAAIVHRQGSMLPRYRVELYQLIGKTLIETWDKVRSMGIAPIVSTFPDYRKEARELLYPLGLWMHNHFPTGVAPEDELQRFLIEKMVDRGMPSEEAEKSVEALFKALRKRTHILIEKAPQRWGFMHLAFQEYFAAASLVSSDSYLEEIKKNAYNPRWQEVILLVAGEIGINQGRTKAVTDLITELFRGMTKDHLNEEILQKHILMAGRALAEIGGLEDALEKQIIEKLLDFALRSDFQRLRQEACDVLSEIPKFRD